MQKLFAVLMLLLDAVTGSLAGRVVDEDEKPIAGAVVVIDTGRPRRGPSLLCPSCYPECSKRVTTEADGTFKLDQLSDTTLFSLAAGASNYQAEVTSHYDPLKENDIEIVLKRLSKEDGQLNIEGTVVDLDNQPLSNAKIEVRHARDGNRGYGGGDDITSLTLSDDAGKFRLVARKAFTEVQLRASLNGFAPSEAVWLATKPDPLTIRIGSGATLLGRLVHDGKPLANVEVGIVQETRFLGNIVTPFEVITDDDGIFRFEHLPPKLDYAIYTTTNQQAKVVLPVSIVTVPNDRQTADLGDVPTQKPRGLTITVKTDDGSDLPEHSYAMVGREKAWKSSKLSLPQVDSATVMLNDVGSEAFQVWPYIPGYRVLRTVPTIQPDLNKRYLVRVVDDTRVTFIVERVKSNRD